jgi:hypothetical protein
MFIYGKPSPTHATRQAKGIVGVNGRGRVRGRRAAFAAGSFDAMHLLSATPLGLKRGTTHF